jgi:hypothetical protein
MKWICSSLSLRRGKKADKEIIWFGLEKERKGRDNTKQKTSGMLRHLLHASIYVLKLTE